MQMIKSYKRKIKCSENIRMLTSILILLIYIYIYIYIYINVINNACICPFYNNHIK